MIKYFKKGCEHNWSDGCFAAGMKLRYHSSLITDVDERKKSFLEVSSINKVIANLYTSGYSTEMKLTLFY